MPDLSTQLRTYFDEVDPPFDTDDLHREPQLGPAPNRIRVSKGLLVAATTAVLVLLVAVVPLLVVNSQSETATEPSGTTAGESSSTTTVVSTPVHTHLDQVQGLSTSTGSGWLWAWDSEGNVAVRAFPYWSSVASLPDPVIDVAHYDRTFALTTSRCDPTVPGWEGVECETTLWQLVDDTWQQVQALDGLEIADEFVDIEFDSTGTLWMAATDGTVYTYDGSAAAIRAKAGFNTDAVAITGDGRVWASRGNPFFPDDVGFAVLGQEGWKAFNPLDDGNHHTVMALTPDDNLWVWFSEFSSTGTFSGRALGFYNSRTRQWTIHESGIPAGPVRAMTANTDAVWIATFGEASELWRFDGYTWTRLTTNPGAEILDVGVATDGTVWYVADNALQYQAPIEFPYDDIRHTP